MQRELVHLTQMPKNNPRKLNIAVVDYEARQEILEIVNHRGWDWDTQWSEILSGVICNSSWEIIQPEEIGALTDAPLLASYTDRNEITNEIEKIGTVYWYPNYMVSDPIDYLLEYGYVEFDIAPQS